MDKWEYEEFADAFGHAEAWLEFLNKKGVEGWELISYTQERYKWDNFKVYRKCLFKRKIQQENDK